MKVKLRGHSLHTVCESARCPNICECFERGVATFMILGDKCTRSCNFCSVMRSDKYDPLDMEEPKRVALMAQSLSLKHAVITSVTRDDLIDGGAWGFCETIREIRKISPNMTIEILTPDFCGDRDSIAKIVKESPHIFAHNLETVKRLYPLVRSKADYRRSLDLLEYVKKLDPSIITKSGIMVGLGEMKDEVFELLDDLIKVNCDAVNIGHYLRPSKKNIEIKEYVSEETFKLYEKAALDKGFKYVFSGPFVRSSYMADKVFDTK